MINTAQDFRQVASDLAREIAFHGDPRAAISLLGERLPGMLDGGELILLLHGPSLGEENLPGFHLALRTGAAGAEPPLTVWRNLFRANEPRLIRLAEESSEWSDALQATGQKSVYVRPLEDDGKIHGVLALGCPALEGPGPEILSALDEIAALLAALESRVSTHQSANASQTLLEEELRRILTIHEISATLTSSLVLEEIFSATVRKLRGLMPLDRAVLALLEKGDRTVRLVSLDLAKGSEPEVRDEVPVENTISGRIMGRNSPYMVKDLAQVDHPSRLEERLSSLGLVSYIALPLSMGQRPLGSFHLGSMQREAFSEDDLALLTQVAQHIARSVEHARVFREAQSRMLELAALYEVGKTLIQTLDMEELLSKTLTIVKDTFHFQHCAILLIDEETGQLRITEQQGYDPDVVESFHVTKEDWSITATAARTGQPLYVPDVQEDPRYVPGVARGRSELALPLICGDEVLGVLDIESQRRNAFSEAEINSLSLFATQVALALEKARLFRKVQDQAITDGLTGLLNQRAFHDRITKEAERAERLERPFSLILIDMDNLKEINDQRGHLVGNRAICAVAEAIRFHSRGMDHTARFGGDEFALILPEADGKQAVGAAERFRRTLGDLELGDDLKVSVSCGVATFPKDSKDVSRLIVLADRAMYEAKRRGRNQVATVADLPAEQ